jgi:hypothetical protein
VLGVIARRALPLLAGVLLLAGCGSSGGSPAPSSSGSSSTEAAGPTEAAETAAATESRLTIRTVDASRFVLGSSVGFGEGPAPSFAPAVKRAARNARCGLRSDPSAVGIHLLISDVVPLHQDNPSYRRVPRPPTNGHHRPLWADWGFYQQPVPYAYEVHNLEHGAVVIHLGLNINRIAGTKVLRMWADSPPFLLIVPGLPADVSRRGATITSWQRAMICKTWNPRTLNAIRTYRDIYRGTGPEQVPSLNTGTGAHDLPRPVLANPSAG